MEKRIRPLFKCLTSEQKALLWDQIRQIKAKMNTKREKSLNKLSNIKITPYWLLGFKHLPKF